MVMIINPGGEGSIYRIQLATSANRPIRNERRPREKKPEQLRAAVELHKKNHPHITLRSMSADYNCMGLVFASRRTSIDIDDSLQQILDEDGYRKIAVRDVQPGDVVLYLDRYKKPAHIGVILEHRARPLSAAPPPRELDSWHIMVLSQWGTDGEYIHDLMDVHYEWRETAPEFLTEKKII